MKKIIVSVCLVSAMVLNAGTVLAAEEGLAGNNQPDYAAPLHYELESVGTIDDPEDSLAFMYDALLDYNAEEPTMLSSDGSILAEGLDDLDYLGGGLYSARTPLEDDNVNKTGLYTSDGEELIPGDAASIVLPENREADGSARFVGVVFTTEETDNEDDCIIYFTSDMISLSVGEDDVMYKGYFKVYDLENRQYVPGLELDSFDPYGFYDLGDSFIIKNDETAALYDADGQVLVDIGEYLGDAGYNSFVMRDGSRYRIMDSKGNESFAADEYQGIYIAGAPLDYYEIYDGDGDAAYHLIDMQGNRVIEDPLPIIYEISATAIITEDADGNQIVMDYTGAVIDDEPYGREFPIGGYGAVWHDGTDDVTVITPESVYHDLSGYDEYALIFTKDDQIVELQTGSTLGAGFSGDDIGNVLRPGLVSIVDPSSDRYSDPVISVYDILTGAELLPDSYQEVEAAGDHIYAKPIGSDAWEVYKVHLVSDGESIVTEEADNEGDAAAEEAAAGTDEEEAEELAAEDEGFETGEESGQSYVQDFFGFRMDLPEGWAFANEDELSQISNDVADVVDDEAKEALETGSTFMDMYAENGETFNTANATITKISVQEALMARLDLSAMLESIVPELEKQYVSMNFADIEVDVSETQYLGETVPCIVSNMSVETDNGSIPLFQKQIYMQKGTYMLCLTATSYFEDTTQEIFDACSAL